MQAEEVGEDGGGKLACEVEQRGAEVGTVTFRLTVPEMSFTTS